MKSISKMSRWILLLGFFMVSFQSKAENCGIIADKFCEILGYMGQEVKKINSLEGFETVNFDGCLNKVDFSGISDSCLNAEPTKAEKTKMKNGVSNFFNAFIDKTCQLGGGMISRADIEQMFESQKKAVFRAIDNARTYYDVMNSLSALQ